MQGVCIDGIISTWKLVLSGVPQGSVLEPLLFLIFVNDLDLNIHNILLKFADDTKICSRICSIEDKMKLQEDLNTLAYRNGHILGRCSSMYRSVKLCVLVVMIKG